MEPKPQKWTVTRSRYIPALWPLWGYFSWDYKGYYGIPATGRIVHIFDKGQLTASFEVEQRKYLVEAELKILEKVKDLKELRQKEISSGTEVVKKIKEFAESVEGRSISEISDFLKVFPEIHMPIMRDNMFHWLISSVPIENKIKEKLADRSQEEVQEIFSVLLHPTETSYSHIVESQLDKIAISAKKNGIDSEKLKKEIDSFSRDYFWFPYEYVGPNIWTPDVVYKKIRERMSADVKPHESNDKVVADQKEIIKRFSISEEIQRLFSMLRTFTLMQDDRKMFMSQLCYYLNGVVFGEVAKRLGMSIEEARFLDSGLLDRFSKDSKEVKKELRDRMEFTVTVNEDGKRELYTLEEARKFLKSVDFPYGETLGDVAEVKGQIANKGKATGRVRVLRTSHVDDFKDGEIIVTGMTTPDFVPLIKKSSAIVTDEGGVTCHAAIVSRELNKPCIIGTKMATKVFKDGDMVEVDAERGVVRKIQ